MRRMKYLVFGKSGQVAQELARLPVDINFLSRNEADLSSPGQVADHVAAHAPDAVINAAAWTDVDGAEAAAETAMAVNGLAPGEMAAACAAAGIPLVHISTDYVFDGQGTQTFAPGDDTGPLGVYGRTKLAGEKAVVAAGGAHGILRTAWVFSPHGKNFVKTMLRLAETRDKVNVVSDQIGGPTPARAIAEACVAVAQALRSDPQKSGIYHFSGAPDVSWAEFARAVFEVAGLDVAVEDIPSSAYPTPARRPANSRLDCDATERVFGLPRPDWRAELEAVVSEVKKA